MFFGNYDLWKPCYVEPIIYEETVIAARPRIFVYNSFLYICGKGFLDKEDGRGMVEGR